MNLFDPLGSALSNRLAKAAIEENMVDGRAMTGPGGVVLKGDAQLARFERWASVGRAKGAQFWLQINHLGRQMQANLGAPT